MNTKHPKKRRFIILFLIAGLLLAILWIAIPPCPMEIPVAIGKPDYIDSVWPSPGERVPAGCIIRRSMSWPVPVFLPIIKLAKGEKDFYNVIPTPGIVVKIIPMEIINELGEREEFSQRVILYLDDKKSGSPWDMLDDSSLIHARSYVELTKLPNVPGWYYFGWYPMLLPGEHTARFVIVKKDGTTLEYEWNFTITWW